MVCFRVPFDFFYSGDCFYNVVFFLISGFVSVNVHFELIVRDKLSSLQMLFFSFKSVFCVFVCLYGCSCRCIGIYFRFYSSSPFHYSSPAK